MTRHRCDYVNNIFSGKSRDYLSELKVKEKYKIRLERQDSFIQETFIGYLLYVRHSTEMKLFGNSRQEFGLFTVQQ